MDRCLLDNVGWEPWQRDRIEFPSWLDLPTFQVVSAGRDGMARMQLKLVPESHQA